MQKMSATGRREAGTTLLEALVVVSITALVAGLVFPNVQRTLDVLSLRQSATVFVANLRSARAEAMRTDEPVQVTLAADGGGYRWSSGEQRLSHGVALSRQQPAILFYPDGGSSGGAFSLDAAGRRVGVSVDSATGAVRIGP